MPTFFSSAGALHERNRFAGLFIAQIVAIFVLPIVSTQSTELTLFRVAVWILLLAGVYAAAARRAALVITVLLLIPAIFAWMGPDYFTGEVDELLRLVSASICFTFTAGVVAAAVMKHDRVSTETLLGGVNAYLLLAFAFMLAHLAIAVAKPESYTVLGHPLRANGDLDFAAHIYSTFVYFSFTTLTTLGYGDIVPSSEAARLMTSAEAVVGQLFVAIFIGRLVGLQVGEKVALARHPEAATEDRGNDSEPVEKSPS